ncbi:hypothetical protein D9O29_08530 [Pantoea vagans]|uniref:Uncharacterized protein n=1 Tax=Pantoea vagans TaxID=470934 RepID=A0ABY3LG98_9GAMM|nr:hypothetical protein D9O29_08530 [Pantoea vagans]
MLERVYPASLLDPTIKSVRADNQEAEGKTTKVHRHLPIVSRMDFREVGEASEEKSEGYGLTQGNLKAVIKTL